MAVNKKVLDNWFQSFSKLMEENRIYMDERISQFSLKILPDPEEMSQVVDHDIDVVVTDPETRAKVTPSEVIFPNKSELVSDDWKEELYQLSKANRLVIAGPKDKMGDWRLIRTDEDNRLFITPTIDQMAEAFETRDREGIGLSGFSSAEQYNRFAASAHNMTLIQHTIDADAKKTIADRETKQVKNFNSQKPELGRLLERLKKTDSHLSNDSEAYRNLEAALSVVMTSDDPKKAMQLFAGTFRSEAERYLNDKKSLKSLSRRQIERLRIINQILDIGDQLAKDHPEDSMTTARNVIAEKLVMAIAEDQVGQKRKSGVNRLNDPAAWQDALTDRSFRQELIGQIAKSRSYKVLVENKTAEELRQMAKISRKSLLARAEKISEKTAKEVKKVIAEKQKKQKEPNISL